MIRLRLWGLTAIAVAFALFGSMFNYVLVHRAHTPWHVSPPVCLVLVAIGIYVLIMGWSVRGLKIGKPTKIPITPQAAVYVLLLAQSLAILGSVIAGFTLGQILTLTALLESQAGARGLWEDVFTAVCSVLIVVFGMVVQHWCSIDNDQDQKLKKPTFRELNSPQNADPAHFEDNL